MMLYEQVQAYDELDMSVMRLRERLPDEPESDAQQIYIIEPAEVNNKLPYPFSHTWVFSERHVKVFIMDEMGCH